MRVAALIHDLGKALGSGAHLAGLRRTKIGDYAAEGAKTPEQWSQHFIDVLKKDA